MGLFDRSSSTSNVSNLNDNRQVAQSDISGIAVAQAEGPVTITQTDAGAIEAGVGVARDSIDAARDFQAGANALAADALNAGVDNVREALDFGRDSIYAGTAGLETVTGFAGDVLDAGRAQNADTAAALRSTTDTALQFGDRITGEVIEASRSSQASALAFAGDTVRSVVDAQSGLLDRVISDVQARASQFVGAVNDSFARESGNTDARLENVTKYALIAVGVVAGAAVLLPIVRGFAK